MQMTRCVWGGGVVTISQNRLKVQRHGVLFSKILLSDENCGMLKLAPWLGRGCEKVLGVLENHKLSTRQHCAVAAKRANVVLGYSK